MTTYENLVNKFEALAEGDIINIDGKDHKVITNIHDDVVFLTQVDDESKSFHLFYDELDPSTDDFVPVGKNNDLRS